MLATIGHEALVGGLVLADDLLGALGLVLVAVHGVLGLLELHGPSVGVDDGAKGTGRGDEERAEGQGEAAEGWVASRGDVDTSKTDSETEGATDETALDDGGIGGLLCFFAEDIHDDVLIDS